MQTMKKALAIFLAVAMVFTSVNLPVGAYAQTPEAEPIVLSTELLEDGEALTNGNTYNVPTSVSAGGEITVEGNVTLNIESGQTLTSQSANITLQAGASLTVNGEGTIDITGKTITVPADGILNVDLSKITGATITNSGLVISKTGDISSATNAKKVSGGYIEYPNGLYNKTKAAACAAIISGNEAVKLAYASDPVKIFTNGLREVAGRLYYDGSTESVKFKINAGNGVDVVSVTPTDPSQAIQPDDQGIYTLASNNLASNNTLAIVLKYKDLSSLTGNEYEIDYDSSAETITASQGYEIMASKEDPSQSFKAAEGAIQLKDYLDKKDDKNIWIRKAEKKSAGTIGASNVVKVNIPARPEAPVGFALDYVNEKITGITESNKATLEYSTDNGSKWDSLSGATIKENDGVAFSDFGWDGASVKNVKFRTAAVTSSESNKFASEATAEALTIPARDEALKAGLKSYDLSYENEIIKSKEEDNNKYEFSFKETTEYVSSLDLKEKLNSEPGNITVYARAKAAENKVASKPETLTITGRATLTGKDTDFTVDYNKEEITIASGYMYKIDAENEKDYANIKTEGTGKPVSFKTGKLSIYKKADAETAFKSKIFNFDAPSKIATPDSIAANYTKSEFDNTNGNSLEYATVKKGDVYTWIDHSGKGKNLTFKDINWTGEEAMDVYFRIPNSDSKYASEVKKVTLKVASEAPVITANYKTEVFDGVTSENKDNLEYSINDGGEWNQCPDLTLGKLPFTSIDTWNGDKEVTVIFRTKGTALAPASVATKPIKIGLRAEAPAQELTNYEISYTEENIGNLPKDTVEKVGKYEFSFTNDGKGCSSELNLTEKLDTGSDVTVYVREAAVEGKSVAGAFQTLTIPARPKVTEVTINYVKEDFDSSKINDAMEYYSPAQTKWIACTTAPKFADFGWDGSKAVDAKFRVKQTGDAFAGITQTLPIKARPDALENDITVNYTAYEASAGTVTATANVEGSNVEYKCVGEGIESPEWQVSGKFTGLKVNKEYKFYARTKQTGQDFAGVEKYKDLTYLAPTVSVNFANKEYTGENQIPGKSDITVLVDNQPVTENAYKIEYTTDKTGSQIQGDKGSAFKNAGVYAVVVSDNNPSDKYFINKTVVKFEIQKKVVTTPIIVMTQNKVEVGEGGDIIESAIKPLIKVYANEADKKANKAIEESEYDLAFSNESQAVQEIAEEGKYTVTVKAKEKPVNYDIKSTATAEFEVVGKGSIVTPEITFPDFGNGTKVTYNGTAQYPKEAKLSVTGSNLKPEDYEVIYAKDELGNNIITSDKLDSDIINAGTYYVIVRDAKEDAKNVKTIAKAFTIDPATLTLTEVEPVAINKVYDGSNEVNNIKITVSGFVNGEEADLYGKGTLAQAKVGSGLAFTYNENGFEFRNPQNGFIESNYKYVKPETVSNCSITAADIKTLSDQSVDVTVGTKEEQTFDITKFGTVPAEALGTWAYLEGAPTALNGKVKGVSVAENNKIKFTLEDAAKAGDKAVIAIKLTTNTDPAKNYNDITVKLTVNVIDKPSGGGGIIPTPTPDPEKPVVPEVKPDVEKPALPTEPPKSGANIGMDQAQQAEADKTIDEIVNNIVKPADPEKPAPAPQTEAEKETAKTEAAITEAAKNNEKVKINVESKPVEKSAVAEDAKKIEEKLADSFGEQKVEILQFANIDVVAEATDNDGKTRELGNLRNIEKPLTFSFQLPAETTGKYFGVARIHDGIVELLPAEDVSYDPITKKITFKTDKFSTYAVYETEEPEVKPEPPVDPEKPDQPVKPEQPVKPGIVKNVKVKTDNGLLKVTFNKATNADGYRVYVKQKGNDWRWYNGNSKGTMIKKIYKKALVKNGQYQVKVVAMNGEVKGKDSNIVKVYANRLGNKSSVMPKTKINRIKSYKGKITVYAKNIKFTSNPKKVAYQVSYKLKGTNKWHKTGYSFGNVKTVKGLKVGKTYNVAVRYRYKSALDGKTFVYSDPAYMMKTVW